MRVDDLVAGRLRSLIEDCEPGQEANKCVQCVKWRIKE